MPKLKSCGAVVFKKNREVEYLLLRYGGLSRRRYWGFVKGLVEPNESETDTVMRELKEETGITEAHLIRDFREKISYSYRRGRDTIYKEVVYFIVQAQKSEVRLSYEHTGYVWLNYQKAMNQLTFKNAKNVLRKAHQSLKRREY